MSFDLSAVLCIGVTLFVTGCWIGSHHRKPNDFESWRAGFSAGFNQASYLAGPPRFIGEEDENEEGPDSAGPTTPVDNVTRER